MNEGKLYRKKEKGREQKHQGITGFFKRSKQSHERKKKGENQEDEEERRKKNMRKEEKVYLKERKEQTYSQGITRIFKRRKQICEGKEN